MSALGIAIGLTGVVLLLHPGGANATPWQALVVLCSPLLWSIGSLYAQHAPTPAEPGTSTAMGMLAGGFLLFVAGVIRGEVPQVHLGSVTGASLGAFIYLVLIGSLVGYSAYIWLLHHVSSTSASTYAFVNPLVAVALGAIVLSEPITPATLIAAALIVAAVAVILAGQARAATRVVAKPIAQPCEAPVSEVA
jgi:drug/metabolite transporter (DMT)-like permease